MKSSVEKAFLLIERIELLQSFLSRADLKKVRNTYRTHSFRRIEMEPQLKNLLNPVIRNENYCFVDNPDGTNFAIGIRDLELILKNYKYALKTALR
ncbi:hypothetical protein IQ255_27800 [Pleurocapsales cyanobacterium LEGE 10410]|nr:hypothetical protein [Pleurocapsales cyanobacterium LEGE 10410]